MSFVYRCAHCGRPGGCVEIVPEKDCPKCGGKITGNFDACYPCNTYPDRKVGQCVGCGAETPAMYSHCKQCRNTEEQGQRPLARARR